MVVTSYWLYVEATLSSDVGRGSVRRRDHPNFANAGERKQKR
jgi:hypothetical protein